MRNTHSKKLKKEKEIKGNRYRCVTSFLLAAVLLGQGLLPMTIVKAEDSYSSQATTDTSTASASTNPTYSEELARKVLVSTGAVSSSKTTTSGLKGKVTRQQFAKMLVELSTYKDKNKAKVTSSMYSDVKKTSSYAPYIKIAVDNGWMKGDIFGKFRPSATITLQEAVNGVLAVLGYQNSDFGGNQASAKISFYKSEKLNTNINCESSSKMNYKDTINLLYNMLVTKNKYGVIYGSSIGYIMDANGDVDYLSLVYDELEGPVIAGADWKKQIPFSSKKAAIYIDGSKSSADYISRYDVLYYSIERKSVFVYKTRVTGRLGTVSPDRMTPTSVTVAGTNYKIASQDAAQQVSVLGSYDIGDYITLLLGKDGTVVSIGSAKEMDSFVGGIVLSKNEKINDDEEDDSTKVRDYITMLDTLGEVHEYEVGDNSDFSAHTSVEVTFESGKPFVNKVSLDKLNGTVDNSATSYAGYKLSDNINILEYTSDTIYNSKERNRLAGITINASNVLYYHINSNKEITELMVRSVTGDNCEYGILLSASEIVNSTTMTYQGTYRYKIGDITKTGTASGSVFGMNGYIGPAQFEISNSGSLTGIKTLNNITVSSVTGTELSNGKVTYAISDEVSVYMKKDGSYYMTTLSKVKNLSSYELTAYYDGTVGGRVRIIIATAL